MDINTSPTLVKYKDVMGQCMRLYYPEIPDYDIRAAIDYSIQKRMYNSDVYLTNSYKRHKERIVDDKGNESEVYIDARQKLSLQQLSDYILSREPIVTAYGTMFMHHGTIPNPLYDVVQSFLDNRTKHKKQMFEYPKGSEQFEKYNLLQSLDKIDANGIYGTLGMYSSLIYNSNVATSITSQGRAAVSSMTLHFEMFLADNVKFGSLDQLVEFVNNIVKEEPKRKFNDLEILNHIPTKEECFAKLILDCGYRWIPNDEELDVIWKIVNNLSQYNITRIYYKNNLYEFASNVYIMNIIKTILVKLEKPFYASADCPEEIKEDMNYLTSLMMEYVYYRYMYIDRIDRCDNMIKSVTMVSDTDSTIISVDAWYRFVANQINGMELKIANYSESPLVENDNSEDFKEAKVLKYNFNTDEIEELDHINHPDIDTPNDNVRYSIISIIGYVLDHTVNDYMIKMCENKNSVKDKYHAAKECKIWAKSEFLFKRLMMTQVKKNYASLIELQEGNLVRGDAQLDVKGIEALTKSSKPLSTRKALQKILLEDILDAPVIDQMKFINDIAVFEKQIVNSVKAGNKEYYKPVTIKSMSAYDDPMKIQGIKASIAWNFIRSSDLEAINLDERNAVDIVKVNIDRNTVSIIEETYPEVYANMIAALDDDTFKTYVKNPKTGVKDKVTANEITAVALPLEVELPDWLVPFIDYASIVNDNIGGFPYESIGIQTLGKSGVNYTNIVKL